MEVPAGAGREPVQVRTAGGAFGHVVGRDGDGVAVDIQRATIVVVVTRPRWSLDAGVPPRAGRVALRDHRAPVTFAGAEDEAAVVVLDVRAAAAAVGLAYPARRGAAEDAGKVHRGNAVTHGNAG